MSLVFNNINRNSGVYITQDQLEDELDNYVTNGKLTTNLSSKASLSGDSFTGPVSLPSLIINGLSGTGALGIDSLGDVKIIPSYSPTGTIDLHTTFNDGISIKGLAQEGILKNDSQGLITSGSITNANIVDSADIVDTKLATISTAGKVANSATTASTSSAPDTIMLRDTNQYSELKSLSLTDMTTPGVLHNSNTGLLSSSLISNSDITDNTISAVKLAGSIPDSKLSIISSSGKVANSATSATGANVANCIVLRDSISGINVNHLNNVISFSGTGTTSFNGPTIFNGTGTFNNSVFIPTSNLTIGGGRLILNQFFNSTGPLPLGVNTYGEVEIHQQAKQIEERLWVNDNTLECHTGPFRINSLANGSPSDIFPLAVDHTGKIILDTSTPDINTDEIEDLAITTAKLANLAVSNAKLALLSVDSGNIINGAINNDKIAIDAVGTDEIQDGSITNSKLALLSVDTGNLINGSVTRAKIESGAVSANEIASGTITSNELANGCVTQLKIPTGQILGVQLVDHTLIHTQMATGGIAGYNIANSQIVNTHIVDSTIDGATKLVGGSITANQIASGTITAEELASNSVTTAKILDVNVTSAKLAGSIPDSKLSTISTAGKVANSATTATNAATGNTIALRDSSGNSSFNRVLVNDELWLNASSSFPTIIVPAAATATRHYGIPDMVKDCNFIMSTGPAQTIGGGLNVNGSLKVNGIDVSTGISPGSISNADIAYDAAIVDTKLATISTAGKVSNSATTATSFNLLNSIVARGSDGNIACGPIYTRPASAATGGNYIMINVASSPAANRTYTMPDVGGNATFIMSTGSSQTIGGGLTLSSLNSAGVVHTDSTGLLSTSNIVNADIDAAAAIADTKLATISTSGKVANSATTATSANTNNAIVARDNVGRITTAAVFFPNGSNGRTYAVFGGNEPAASRLYSMVDVGKDAIFIMSTGANQTIGGGLTLSSFGTAGIVHNSSAGLLSSSLIVNADVDAAAAIADTKLATISTSGKVSNSATTATSANTANAIVARDSAGLINIGRIAVATTNNATPSAITDNHDWSTTPFTGPNTEIKGSNMTLLTLTSINQANDTVPIPTNYQTAQLRITGGIGNASSASADGQLGNATNFAFSAVNSGGSAPIPIVLNSNYLGTSLNPVGIGSSREHFTIDTNTSRNPNYSLELRGPWLFNPNPTGASNEPYYIMSGTRPAANRTYTIPDAGANATFIMSTRATQNIGGTLTLSSLNSAGIVHTNSTGTLSSSLIINNDITDGTIQDTKLATISSAGKVSNSATTATGAFVANTIALRDSNGKLASNYCSVSISGTATNNATFSGSDVFGGITLSTDSINLPIGNYFVSYICDANTGNVDVNKFTC